MPKRNKEEKEEKERTFSRRTFGQKAGLAGVAAILGTSKTSSALTQDSSNKNSGDIYSAELEMKFRRVLLRYGDRLSAEQQTHIHKILEFNETMMQLIREFHLENGQGTATTFKLCPDPAILLARAARKS